MNGGAAPAVGSCDPDEAWQDLSARPDALLVDVRTRAEWTFVGAPDLSEAPAAAAFIEWNEFPGGRRNEAFLDQLDDVRTRSGADRIYFLCRSGARSQAAAEAAATRFAQVGESVRCVNVVEGFEGDLDETGRRGRVNGWKARGLPWRQS